MVDEVTLEHQPDFLSPAQAGDLGKRWLPWFSQLSMMGNLQSSPCVVLVAPWGWDTQHVPKQGTRLVPATSALPAACSSHLTCHRMAFWGCHPLTSSTQHWVPREEFGSC